MSVSSNNFTRTHPIIATVAYYLSFIILGMTTAASGPSLLKLADHTSSGLDRISLIFIFGSLGYVIGSYFGGRAYDRFPGHKLMAVTLLLIAVASVMIPLSTALSVLLFAMFLSGLASGILDVGCNTLLLWTYRDKAGPFMNGLHFFFGVGSLVAPLLLAQVLLRTNDIYWLYYSFAIVSLPIMIWLWLMAEPSHSVQEDAQTSSTFPVIPVILIVMLFLLYVGLELGFGNWIYTYALSLRLGTTVTAAYLTSAFWGSFTVGRLLGIWVSTRLRAQTTILVDLIGCAISTIIIMLWKESSVALWIGTFGLGLSMASIFPNIMMLAGERMQITGAITGWFLVGSGAGGMLIPWLLGQIFARTGPQLMTTVLLTVTVGIFVVLLIFMSQYKLPVPKVVETN
jgi:FHS family Na+ dependent glucose MFS transporter 1